ncbi:MAG: type II secretion system protein GspD, partial [Pseudomonadota bacterium]
ALFRTSGTIDRSGRPLPAQVSGADIPPGGESRRLQQQDFFPGSGLPDLSIVPDVRNNALLIRSSYEDFLQIRELVIALDVPQPQLVLEGTILQVDLNDTLEFGVQFFLQENGLTVRNSEFAGGLITPDGLGLTALGNVGAISGLGLEILVSALQQVTDVKVISSPYLSVVSGQTASLTVGDEIPFLTATQDSAQTGEVVVTNEVETRQTGITVEVTPQIRPDDSVRMQIITNVSNALPTVAGAELTPTIARRDLQSEVTVRSGGTIVLGGLISGTLTLDEGGIPVLREIPILGNLFGVTDSEVRRSELIVLMTPRVTRTAFEIERITEQVRAQIAID